MAKKNPSETSDVEAADPVDPVAELTEAEKTEAAIRAAFDAGKEAEDGEETIKMAMLQAGCKIKSVVRLYNTYMIDSGQMASKEQKDTALDSSLEDVSLETEDEFNEAVESLVPEIKGATDQSVATMIRAWAKRKDVTCYVKPKGESISNGFTKKFHDALVADSAMTKEVCAAFMAEHGTKNTLRHATSHQKTRLLVNNIRAAVMAEFGNEDENAEAA